MGPHLTPLVSDKSDDHGVEVEEEHQQVEAELDEGFLLVHVQLPEDLGSVEQVLVLEDPVGTLLAHFRLVDTPRLKSR